MIKKIKKSIVIIGFSLLLLCLLPIYFVINKSNKLDVKSQAPSSDTALINTPYFEYELSEDPFNGIDINGSDFSSGSNKIFIRNNQQILIDPKENEDCGDKIAVKIEHRPALMCRGGSYFDKILNDNCKHKFNICKFKIGTNFYYKKQGASDECDKIINICLPNIEDIAGCINTSSGIVKINKDIEHPTSSLTSSSIAKAKVLTTTVGSNNTITADNIEKLFLYHLVSCTITSTTATNCISNLSQIISNIGVLENGTASYATFTSNFAVDANNLSQSCTNAITSQQIPYYVADYEPRAICYDLEEYVGRVADIPFVVNSLLIDKGLKTLAKISNTEYGNLHDPTNTYSIDENSAITNIGSFKVPESRNLKLMFIDNDDLKDSFNRSSPLQGEFSIKFNKIETYKNGQMLKVILCQEDADSYDMTPAMPKYNSSYSSKCNSFTADPKNITDIITYTYSSDYRYGGSPKPLAKNIFNSDGDAVIDDNQNMYYKDSALNLLLLNDKKYLDLANFKNDDHTDSEKQTIKYSFNPGDISVEKTTNTISQSPYSFNEDGQLKFSLGISIPDGNIRGLPENADTVAHPCLNYDSSIYCHNIKSDAQSKKDKGESYEEKNIVAHDLRFVLGFQIDDPELPQINNPNRNQYYPNSFEHNSATEEANLKIANKAYSNNEGSYTVRISVSKPEKEMRTFFEDIIKKMVEIITLGAYQTSGNDIDDDALQLNCNGNPDCIELLEDKQKEIKSNTVCDSNSSIFVCLLSKPQLRAIIDIFAIIMIAFFAISYLMGLSELNHINLVSTFFKLAFVYSFLHPSMWYFYDEIVVKSFTNGLNNISYTIGQVFASQESPMNANAIQEKSLSSYFYSSITALQMITLDKNHLKILSLAFSYPFGFVYVYIIYYGIFIYIIAIANAILMFMLAKVVLVIMLNIAPLMLLTMIFKASKKMISNWLSIVMGFAFQQIFIIIAVAFFNIMIVYILKTILGYKICWGDILSINKGSLGGGYPAEDIPIFKFWRADSSIPSLFHILYFLILSYLLRHFVSFAADLGSSIADGVGDMNNILGGIKNDLNNNSVARMAKEKATAIKDRATAKIKEKMFGKEDSPEEIERKNKNIYKARNNLAKLKRHLKNYELANLDRHSEMDEGDVKKEMQEISSKYAQSMGYKNQQMLEEIAKQDTKKTYSTALSLLSDATKSVRPVKFGGDDISGKKLTGGIKKLLKKETVETAKSLKDAGKNTAGVVTEASKNTWHATKLATKASWGVVRSPAIIYRNAPWLKKSSLSKMANSRLGNGAVAAANAFEGSAGYLANKTEGGAGYLANKTEGGAGYLANKVENVSGVFATSASSAITKGASWAKQRLTDNRIAKVASWARQRLVGKTLKQRKENIEKYKREQIAQGIAPTRAEYQAEIERHRKENLFLRLRPEFQMRYNPLRVFNHVLQPYAKQFFDSRIEKRISLENKIEEKYIERLSSTTVIINDSNKNKIKKIIIANLMTEELRKVKTTDVFLAKKIEQELQQECYPEIKFALQDLNNITKK